MFTATRILDRDLGVIEPVPDCVELERTLESFCERLQHEAIDERNVDEAARTYVQRLAQAGLLGYLVPSSDAAVDPSAVKAVPLCIIRQWLARYSGALDTAFVMQGLGSYPIIIAGSPSLKQRVLAPIAAGSWLAAFAITEPDAGSDVAAMSTSAEPLADGSTVLRGIKTFISNAPVADSYVVFARERDPDASGNPQFGAFWVPGDAPGLSVEPFEVIAPHPIGTVHLDGVRVPGEHRIGAAGQGLRIALGTLDLFRVTVGAAALGLADRALSEATRHLAARVQFGRPLAAQQGLRFALADNATAHVAAQLLVYRAASARDAGRATPDQSAMAKLYATETAQQVIDRAVQCFGGSGVVVGNVAERLYREVRALRIYEGASEIQKLVIARALWPR
jgi:acyl-CoA dehydrogenase